MKLSVIVPVYNENETILEILTRVRRVKIQNVEIELIVIDDGSKDGTSEKLKANLSLYDTLYICPKNGGKGAAVREGLQRATGDYVVFQDADLEYDPNEFVKLLQPVLENQADVVIGSRVLSPCCVRIHYFWNKLGNRCLTFFFNMCFNSTFSDVYSCYLLFRRNLFQAVELRSSGWEQQAEILALCVRRGRVFYDVGINYHARGIHEGKKIRLRHAVQVFWRILMCRFLRSEGVPTQTPQPKPQSVQKEVA